MIPRRRLVGALAACAASALVLPWGAPILGAVAVVAAAGVDAYLARRGRRAVVAVVPAAIARGRPVAISLGCDAELPASVKQPQTADLRIEPRVASGSLQATVTGVRRGRHTLPEPHLRVTGPLGLAAWGGPAGEPAELDVLPDLPNARRLARAARGGRLGVEGRRRGPLGMGTEFESVRDYRAGDDARRINWRATQRTGRPMTNEFRLERDRDVICAVDCGRLMSAPVDGATRLDAAIDAALAVAALADELGDRAGAVAFDSELRRSVAARRRGAGRVLEALHDLEPRPVESDYLHAFAAVADQKRALVVIFSDVIESTASEPLLAALPILTRRHAVVVASVVDEDLVEALTRTPVVPADVYRQVVAADVDDARARAVSLLTRGGATVVEAPAAELGAACIRAYLRAKVRARL